MEWGAWQMFTLDNMPMDGDYLQVDFLSEVEFVSNRLKKRGDCGIEGILDNGTIVVKGSIPLRWRVRRHKGMTILDNILKQVGDEW